MRYPTDDEHDPEYNTTDDDDLEARDLADEMELERGDQYLTKEGYPRDVHAVYTDVQAARVTNPFDPHPPNVSADTYEEDLLELYEKWRRGNITPANLTINPELPEEDAAFAAHPDETLQRLRAEATDKEEFVAAVEDLIDGNLDAATVEHGQEFVILSLPNDEEPHIRVEFALADGGVCDRGVGVVSYESAAKNWETVQVEITASADLYERLKAAAPVQA